MKIELTEAEAQFLMDILLQTRKHLMEVAGSEVEEYLASIDKNHAKNIYEKLC